MAIGTALATLGSAALGASATKSASKRAQRSTDRALAEQQRQFDLTRGDQAPYREAGVNALERLGQFVDPSTDPQDVMNEPGYRFGLEQGIGNIQNTAAARGGLYSGNALKALTRYGNDYATTKYGDAWNRMQTDAGNRWGRMAALAGIGQTATQQSSQAGQNFANASGNLLTNNANFQGAAGMQRANIWGNALNQLGSMGGNWFGRQSGIWAPGYDDVNATSGGWTGMR